jgi:hypothetical protein
MARGKRDVRIGRDILANVFLLVRIEVSQLIDMDEDTFTSVFAETSLEGVTEAESSLLLSRFVQKILVAKGGFLGSAVVNQKPFLFVGFVLGVRRR